MKSQEVACYLFLLFKRCWKGRHKWQQHTFRHMTRCDRKNWKTFFVKKFQEKEHKSLTHVHMNERTYECTMCHRDSTFSFFRIPPNAHVTAWHFEEKKVLSSNRFIRLCIWRTFMLHLSQLMWITLQIKKRSVLFVWNSLDSSKTYFWRLFWLLFYVLTSFSWRWIDRITACAK